MPMLHLPQQVAGTSDLQILHGDLKAAAQIGKFLDRFQPLLCHFFQDLVPAVHQEGIGSAVTSSDPSPELIKLGKPHAVRIVDDHRIDIGDIDTGLNNRGCDEDIDFSIDKFI